MQTTLSFVVLIATAASVHAASTQHLLRTTRQDTNSCDPPTESCVLVTSCPSLQKLLSPPKPANIQILRSRKCGSQNGRAKVCCPADPSIGQSEGEPTVAPITLPKLNPASLPVSSPASSTASIAPSSGESLLPKLCGHSLPGDKIHGGTPADLGAYPWMAVLGFQNGSESSVEWNCGASLLNDRYVLTAAHCLRRPGQKLTVIRLGENNLSTDKDCKGSGVNQVCAPDVQEFIPEEEVVHPDYETRGYLSDDIALIRLDKAVEKSSFIQPVCLPGPDATFEEFVGNRNPTVIGFGVTEFGRRSTQLLEVLLPTVAREDCRAMANYATTLIEGGGQVCLGGQFQQDACMKDSGGPALVTKNINGPPYVQVAVVSYGNQFCGLRAVPSVYTDVTHYRSWIVDNLKP